MATEIKVPALGESVTSATIARWIKQPGDTVAADEPLVELETDKVTVEVSAPAAGVLTAINYPEGSEVEVGALLGMLDGDASAPAPKPKAAAPPPAAAPVARPAANPPPGINPPPRPLGPVARPAVQAPVETPVVHEPLPAAAMLMEEKKVSPAAVGPGSGKDGRITKGDVLAFLNRPAPAPAAPATQAPPRVEDPREQRVKMTRLRRTIAARLKEAQNTAAMLTTFNEVDMSAVMALRTEYRDAFEKKHGGVRLGFMSVFVRACCVALKEFPAVNAEIDGDDIIYKNYVNMGIAVGGPSGLVVPVIKDADKLGFAGIESAIADFGKRARDGHLKLDDLTGGTFSITNGGIYGSLMSTPILNPPQSAILGMHKIQERPMVIGGKIEVRPMMYLAVSYDHRIVDGKEAVSFLVRVKEGVEDPRRLLLEDLTMFDHIGLAVRDLAKTRAFYTSALAPLGLGLRYDENDVIAFGPSNKCALWFYGKGDGPTSVHIALKAETRAQVDAFHKAAIAAGGKDNGPPGLRPHYAPTYYGAFVFDPDGHNLEAVCYAAET